MQLDEMITEAKNSYKTNRYRTYRECFEAGINSMAEIIRSQNSGKPLVSRSVEFEKPQPTLSADEIKTTAEMLWKKRMKLDAVKMAMKLGYSLKDAKAYCELHFG